MPPPPSSIDPLLPPGGPGPFLCGRTPSLDVCPSVDLTNRPSVRRVNDAAAAAAAERILGNFARNNQPQLEETESVKCSELGTSTSPNRIAPRVARGMAAAADRGGNRIGPRGPRPDRQNQNLPKVRSE